ncbi:MAG TPA: hypothetical protein VGB87_01060, partial [Vicinamibacteria bacterium]
MPDWTRFDRALASRRRALVERFVEFLRMDTVSQVPARVRAGGEWLAGQMVDRGVPARVLETGGNPAVFGHLPCPGARRTVLIYCHYDVKPAPPERWLQPDPFEPVLRRGAAEDGSPAVALGDVPPDALGDHRLYARGSSDDKGPIWAHLEAVALMREVGP